MAPTADPAATMQVDAGASTAFEIRVSGLGDKQAAEYNETLIENAGGSQQLGDIVMQIAWDEVIRVRDRLKVVPGIFGQASIVDCGAVRVDSPPFTKKANAAVRSLTD